MAFQVSWADLKNLVDAKNLSVQFVESNGNYLIQAVDGSSIVECILSKESSADLDEFEADYKPSGNSALSRIDPDTGCPPSTPKWAPNGWVQIYHEIEFKTSALNAIHDKGIDNNDKGFTTAKFYNADNEELTTAEDIAAECVKTVLEFMPNHDYSIKSGKIAHIEPPSSAVYLWAYVPLAELGLGLSDIVFCDGGINLEFLNSKTLVGLDGTAATMLGYNGGLGTNKIRFIVRHSVGVQHRIQAIFEYFKAAT